MPPPDFSQALEKVLSAGDLHRVLISQHSTVLSGPYYSWDQMRYHEPPPSLTPEEWWVRTKFARKASSRQIPELLDLAGQPFSYVLCDPLLALIDQINTRASGKVTAPGNDALSEGKERYIFTSLIEEAITSSQLEGASTTRLVAKEMLQSGRAPRDHSEKMVFNNFRAMQAVPQLRDAPLTPELICEIHRIVTDGTLENPGAAGHIQDSDADRVAVWDQGETVLHRPPAAAELPERIARLCAFANGQQDEDTPYLPPLLRPLALHFMIGYDHYFEDGNGRTARAIFYWSMLREGFWLAEYLSVSRLLRKAPSAYARSFLHVEQDEGDLTHFFLYHSELILRAIDGLHSYLTRKQREAAQTRQTLSKLAERFNHRQIALLSHASKHPETQYTAYSHAENHRISAQSARNDLVELETTGLLTRVAGRRRHTWRPSPQGMTALIDAETGDSPLENLKLSSK